MKKVFVLIICWSLFVVSLLAQNVKRPETYNYQRGLEALEEEKQEEALEYLNKDLKENPKNGYALSWIAHLRLLQEDYGRALTAADMALKYLPKKDPEYVIFAYTTRALTYLNLQDTIKAINDYTAAIKVSPETESLYEKRAQVYYEQGKFDLADSDYRKMIEVKPGDVMGYMGLGRNANEQKRWCDAIKHFDYVTKLASEYSSGYSFRAESYLGLEKWNEATDDIVMALSLGWDRKAFYLTSTLDEPAFTMLISKLKVQSIKNPNEETWPYIVGTMYEEKKQYQKAIEYYNTANSKDVSASIYHRISVCQSELGHYEDALKSINQALNLDSIDLSYMARKADIYYEMGNVNSAIAEWDKVLNLQPEYGYGYYRRGWYKELARDMDGAIEDLSMAIVLEPDYSYAYEARGEIYLKQGKRELAEVDFRKVIEIENTPEKYGCIQYAYHGLGQFDGAIAAMDSIIARENDRVGNYYDAACLYARMGYKQKSLEYLQKSLELGYKRFAHIERDFDMDPIRDMPEFKALMKKYNSKENKEEIVAIGVFDVSDPTKTTISEIPFTKEAGVCKVKCNINDLPLYFVFDTGASTVSLSMVEATFMMKNGYLDKKDVVGSQYFQDANGNVSEGTIINIRQVNFGELKLENVRASVVRNQKAPLLLGQSVLSRLGKIEIDNSNHLIKITHTK